MASEQSHREQAEFNHQAAQDLRDTKPDWAVKMCFYSAIHWVEYYAKKQGCNIETKYPEWSLHQSRSQYLSDLAKDLGNKVLWKAYNDLEKESKKARYLQNINTNLRSYYQKQKQKVNKSFQDLQIIIRLLS